jgi:hypothetical protein
MLAYFDAAHDETAFRTIGAALLFPAPVSLFLFSFNKRFLPKLIWKAYAIMLVPYGHPVSFRCQDIDRCKQHFDLRDNHCGLRSPPIASRAELVVAFLCAHRIRPATVE